MAPPLRGAEEHGRQRRQIVDIRPVPPPKVTEYQRISKVCPCCGMVTTPGWDDKAVPVEHADIVAAHGSPVRIGPETLARAALLTCAHYLPIGRARDLLEKLCAIDVSTGFLAGIRGRAARKLEKKFLAHMQTLLAGGIVREVKVVSVNGLLFPHARQVVQIRRKRRRLGTKKWSTETVYAVTDLSAEQANAQELAAWARGHWIIENTVH